MIDTLTSPGCFAAACKVVSRLCAAVLSWVSLPLCAIEPVLSSASASSSFLMPHFTCAEDEMSSFCCPSSLVNVVGTLPLAVTLSVKLPACGLARLAVSWTFATSGRLNCAVK